VSGGKDAVTTGSSGRVRTGTNNEFRTNTKRYEINMAMAIGGNLNHEIIQGFGFHTKVVNNPCLLLDNNKIFNKYILNNK